MLMGCISNLPDMESFHMVGNRTGTIVPYRRLVSMLKPTHETKQQQRIKRCHLKELRLDNMLVSEEGELLDFARCFARTRQLEARWENLKSLEFHDVLSYTCLGPIFRAVAGVGEAEEQRTGRNGNDDHLPCLETFRLVVSSLAKYSRLEDDDAFVRLLKKPSIKHLALKGFLQPRHCVLLHQHLCDRPNIEMLDVSARDFCRGLKHRGDGRDYPADIATSPSPEQLSVVDGALQCLAQLVRANRNVRHLGLGNLLPESHYGGVLLTRWREISVRASLNRAGLQRFLVGRSRDFASSAPAPPCSTRRECVDFLVRLGTGISDDIDDEEEWRPWRYAEVMELEAMFLSIRMRPDLLRLQYEV